MADAAAPAPVAVLIDELRNPELQIRLNSFRQLTLIAKALGSQRTRDELVPYLHEFIDDDDDEVLLVLSEELAKLATFVGGVEHMHLLFAPLELLAGVEEQTVRAKAAESINTICKELPDSAILEHMIPLCDRLASMDWFTSRISACNLLHSIYKRVPEDHQIQLRKSFIKLCGDETPMVRREATSSMGKFVAELEYKDARDEMLSPLAALSKDDQDSVRLLAPQMCVEFMTAFKGEDMEPFYTVVLAMCRDKSWRVRWMAADKFFDMCTALDSTAHDTWQEELVQCFAALLQDNEAEVRTAATYKLDVVVKMFGEERATALMTAINALGKDSCQYARAALGTVIMGVGTVIPRQIVLDQLLPIVLQLLKDADSEVRLNIISKLDMVSEVIGMEKLTHSLLPAIGDLSTDKKWRVRLAIMQHLPRLATQLTPEFYAEKLCEQSVAWLGDLVFTVRKAACETLTELTKVYGKEWAGEHILPKIIAMCSHKSCSYRLTAVFAIKNIAMSGCHADMILQLLPYMLTLSEDTVPNVRFNAAKAIGAVSPLVSAEVRADKLQPALTRLAEDTDPDVKYFSSEAMEELLAAS